MEATTPVADRRLKRVYCDYHGLVEDDTYALNTMGSHRDLERLGVEPTVGLSLTFYMDDADADGNPDDLLVDGVLDRLEPWGWVARVDPASWRHASEDEET